MKARHALWLFALMACEPGPMIELGSWPRDAGESDAAESDARADASQPADRDAGEEDEQDANEEPEPELLVPCSSQIACAAIEHRSHCHIELGHCVECLLHSDCEPGKYCRWNRCEDN